VTGRRFDVVFLDAGGVLVSPHPELVGQQFVDLGLEVDPDLLVAAHYHGMRAIDDARAEPEVFDDYHVAYARHLGVAEHAIVGVGASLDELWKRGGLWTAPLPGAAEGLAAIAATGLPIVIVSNADGTGADLLVRSGLVQVGPGPGVEVRAIIDSGVVGVAKPDPRIFELALDVTGASAARAVHVGDAYQFDVRGARAAGVHPVLVDPLGLRTDVDCDRIEQLVDLIELLG
jgi:putative hydrolase of the HAD superfamily